MQRLRDRVEELERFLGVDRTLTNRLRSAFGIGPDPARILGMILQRNIVTHEAMYIVVYGARPDCDQPATKILDVQVCKTRKALSGHGIKIKTHWGEGWSMSLADKAKVRARLALVDCADTAIDDLPAFLRPSEPSVTTLTSAAA